MRLAGGDQEQAVDLLGEQDVEVARLLRGIAVGVADDGAVAALEHVVLEAAGEVAEEGIGDVGDDDAGRVRAAATHAAGKGIGSVTQLVDGGLYPLGSGGVDVARAVDHVRDGRGRDSGALGDIADGRHAWFTMVGGSRDVDTAEGAGYPDAIGCAIGFVQAAESSAEGGPG